MKKQYIMPQMTVVRIKRMRMICASDFQSVRVDTTNTMDATDDFD